MFQSQDKPSSIYVVLTGCFAEEEKKKKKIVNYYGAGDMIGVHNLLSGHYKTNLNATRNSEVVVFDMTPDEVLKVLSSRPEVSSFLRLF